MKTKLVLMMTFIAVFSCKKDDDKISLGCNCDLIRESLRSGIITKTEILRENTCIDESVTIGEFKTGKFTTNVYWDCD